jgi:hypothetical protein
MKDMEDKEKEVQHTLRQHFSDKKFNSKVRLVYADRHEEVEAYKSRFTNVINLAEAEANRHKNLYNSKVFLP